MDKNNPNFLTFNRRQFIKTSAVLAGVSQLSLPFTSKAENNSIAESTEKIVWNTCPGNCHSRCALRLHVKDNEVYQVETDNTGDDIYGNHQVRACLRGRSIRRVMNHPDRLKYPMKRIGKRGEGKFKRISWEEAFDTIADNLKRIVKEYGNEAVYINYSSGVSAGNMLRSAAPTSPFARLMNCYGGYLSYYGTYSRAQVSMAMPYTYGSNEGNATSDIINSKLVVYFGNNPMETRMSGGGITYHLEQAREIAMTKPCCIVQGWGIQRQSNGELGVRAVAMLAILTGNVGIHGGNSGAREDTYKITNVKFPTLKNPVKTKISVFMWTDAIERGPEMTALRDGVKGKDKLDVPIKFIWNYAGNTITNQHSNINKTHRILQDENKCEMIVVVENFMTDSAKYADILLPDLMITEQADLTPNEYAGNMGYLIFGQPATTAKFERKPIYEIASEIAKRLGQDVYDKFTEGKTQEDWLKFLYAEMMKKDKDLPDYENMKKMGIFKKRDPKGHFVAYKAFREDPEKNPLKTPSGKIEIYSEALAKIAQTWELEEGDVIHPLPIYHAGFNGVDDPKRKDYPFQMIGFHYKARTHSSYGNVDILQAANRQEIWINPIDAQAKNIQDGSMIRVFNENGEVRIVAKVTPRIMPGVLAMPQGAWHKANMNGDQIDHGGCINTLTTHRSSPLAKGNPQHSNLVQVERL